MRILNSWRSPVKQFDKIDIKVRISALTLVALYCDLSSKEIKFSLLNFTIANK